MNRLVIMMIIPLVMSMGLSQNNKNTLIREARQAQKNGDLETALKKLDQAVVLPGAGHRLFVLRGMVHQQKGDDVAAAKDFSEAIHLSPKAVAAYFNRGLIRLDSGSLDGALADFENTVQINPDHPEAHFLKALCLYKLNRLAEVVTGCDAALRLKPKKAEIHCLRGFAYFKQGLHREALKDFERATILKNDYPMAYYGRARAHGALGQKYDAADQAGIACALDGRFCQAESFEKMDETLLIINPFAKAGDRYCACALMFNEEIHHEEKVQALLKERKARQLRSAAQYQTFKNFRFTDRYLDSGITFLHKIVEDSGRTWKPVHYDHGNGVAVADVDMDGLLDVYFVSQRGSNELYRNLGGGKFENITEKAGVGVADRICVAASFGDINNDGDPDLFVTTVKMGNILFENRGDGTFGAITKYAGLDHVGHSSGATFFDYDNDGLLDLFVTNVGVYTDDELRPSGFYNGLTDAFAGHLKPERAEESLLYRNQGNGKFVVVNDEVRLKDKSWSGEACFTDFNGDRFPDLYVLNMQGDDHYYENVGGRYFEDKTSKYFAKTSWGAMSGKFFDFNNDGRMDLYTTDMHSDMSANVLPPAEKNKSDMKWTDEFLQGGSDNIFGNSFYRNEGNGVFAEVSSGLGLENYWPWGFSTGDINADGFEDIFVASSMNHPFRYGINSLFLNHQGEKFIDSEFVLGIEPRPMTVKPWFDLDCSGADADQRPCKGRQGPLVVWGCYGSRSSAIFDLDGDGDLDIITNEFNSEPLIFISNLAEKQKIRFVKIALVGSKSNRFGLGALVKVHAGGKTFHQYYEGKSGYLSQSLMPLYFGLGDADKIDKIEVAWPSGRNQTLTSGLGLNQLIRIVEP